MNINGLNIKTSLKTCPNTCNAAHDILVITRGATAIINFDLFNKIYNMSGIDQLTFLFSQGSKTFWFKMFTYLAKSSDTTPVSGKVYYRANAIAENSLQYAGERVADEAVHNPKEQGLFEEIDGTYSWRSTPYIVDSHFYHSEGDSYDYITFILNPDETCKFTPTTPCSNMLFEVAARLNTDRYVGWHNQDSTIIEPQHSIAVVDSLYSGIIQ